MLTTLGKYFLDIYLQFIRPFVESERDIYEKLVDRKRFYCDDQKFKDIMILFAFFIQELRQGDDKIDEQRSLTI